MGHRTSRRDLKETIDKPRIAMPGIAPRITPISGLPEETEEDQGCILDFVERTHFGRFDVFPYSREEDISAMAFLDQVSKEIKRTRRNEIMELQQRISRDNLQHKVGAVLDVSVEDHLPGDDVSIGHTYIDALGVDGYLFLPGSGTELMSGNMVPVLVIEASECDLKGVLYKDDSTE